MKHLAGILLALLLVVGGLSAPSHSQEEPKCRALDANEAKELLPERVWLKTETIPVDMKNFSGLQFTNKTRVAIAPLITPAMSWGSRRSMRSSWSAKRAWGLAIGPFPAE
jgi:hypothetical protein